MVEGGFYQNFLDAYLWDNAIFNGAVLDKLTPQFHKEIYAAAETNRFMSVGCPVRFGKSACCSFVIPIADACLQRAKKILLISSGSGLAEDFLADIKQVFETNDLIKNEFGLGKGEIWRADHIKLPNGVEIIAKGWASNIRGGGYDLIVPDDIENDEEVESEDRRVKKKDWFSAALFGRLQPNARMIVVGSLIHPLCLVKWILDDQEDRFTDFWKRSYGAWSSPDGAGKEHSIWPGQWTDEELAIKRRNMSTKAVASELLSNPILSEDQKIKPEWVNTYTGSDVPDFEDLLCVTVLDPASTEAQTKKRDYDAIGTIGMEKEKKNPRFFVLAMTRGHFTKDEKIAAVINQKLKFGSKHFILEGVGAFADLKTDIKKEADRQGMYLEPVVVKPGRFEGDKGVRLESVLLIFEHGRFFIHKNMTRLRDELVMFPRGDHDDEVDVVVHALRFLSKRHKLAQKTKRRQPPPRVELKHDPVSGRLK